MGLFRIKHNNFEEIFDFNGFDTEHANEWEDPSRLEEAAWKQRYDYEAAIISEILTDNPEIKNVLELGSGPGELSQRILANHSDLTYHLVDKPYAKKYFEEKGYKGQFFVKDLSQSFDTSGLLSKYDFVIANDLIEHVYNPHIILKTVYELTHEKSIFFISNPNWRMAHQYVYRGLFDFDNFVYLLYTHMFNLEGFYGSFLKTSSYLRLDSESLLPEESLTDWNHYMLFKHRK
jgi:hypothetical protein